MSALNSGIVCSMSIALSVQTFFMCDGTGRMTMPSEYRMSAVDAMAGADENVEVEVHSLGDRVVGVGVRQSFELHTLFTPIF